MTEQQKQFLLDTIEMGERLGISNDSLESLVKSIKEDYDGTETNSCDDISSNLPSEQVSSYVLCQFVRSKYGPKKLRTSR